MGYLGLRFRDSGFNIVLSVESYVLYELHKPDFVFLPMGPGGNLEARIFLKRSI